MRRHDLDAVLVELVLDVRVQHGHDPRQLPGVLEGDPELVADVKVLEAGLEDERRGVAPDPLGLGRRQLEHRLDLPPRGPVADGHRGRHQRHPGASSSWSPDRS